MIINIQLENTCNTFNLNILLTLCDNPALTYRPNCPNFRSTIAGLIIRHLDKKNVLVKECCKIRKLDSRNSDNTRSRNSAVVNLPNCKSRTSTEESFFTRFNSCSVNSNLKNPTCTIPFRQ